MSATAVLALDPRLAQLTSSDEVYFRLASCVRHLPDCEVVHTPGLEHVPAGCVVQSVGFSGSGRDAEFWIDQVEHEVTRVDARFCRIYLTYGACSLVTALRNQGYRWRQETAFCASPDEISKRSSVTLLRVNSGEAWSERLRMHQESRDNSDGYRVDPASWCKLIEAKCATGIKESYLIESEGKICGSVGLIQMRNLLRFKNLLIRPSYRRRGLGIEVIRRIAAVTEERGLRTLGAFGIEGEDGARLYRAAGFTVAGSQIEWCKQL